MKPAIPSWYRKLRDSFQIRLFLTLALIIFILIPGTGFFAYQRARTAAETQVQHDAAVALNQIADRIRLFLAQHTDTVRLIKSFLEKRMIDPENDLALVNFFHLLKRDRFRFANIYYGDRTGRFVMVPPQLPEIHKVFDPRARPWYEGASASEQVSWTDVYLFASTQKPGITASVRIQDAHDRLQGVCGIDIDLSTLSNFLKSIELESPGSVYIIENRNGRVIAHSRMAQLPWDPDHIQLLSTSLGQLKASRSKLGITTYRREAFFSAYTDFPDNQWTIGIVLSLKHFLKESRRIKNLTWTMVLLGMLISILLSFSLHITIVKPLRDLKQGIERIRHGDLDHKMPPPQLDIAHSVANSFNHMAASLKRSQRALKQTYLELAEKEKLAAVGQMTAVIGHELKNPLGIMQGAAQIVANPSRPMPMREEAARFITDEIERLNKTLTDFLDFAKPATPSFQQTDVIALLEETLAATESQLNDQGIEIDRRFSAQVCRCLVDNDQIRQVLWNIITNAVKAMPDGGRLTFEATCGPQQPPSVAGRLGAQDMLMVTITDNGCGMHSEQVEHIFDPFTSFRHDGVGLGLSIVKQILKQHGAIIHVTSQVDAGTSFQIAFPCIKER